MEVDTEKSRNRYIDCIGIDNLRHICKVDSDFCICGIKVKTKKDKDVENANLFSCYECTY